MSYQAILFDMDGVIIDSEPLYWDHMRKTLQSIGKDMSEDIFKSQVGIASKESAPRLVKALGLDMSPEEYTLFMDAAPMFQDVAEGKTPLHLIEGFEALSKAFAGRLKYAVATGSPPVFRDEVRRRFHLDKNFSAYVSASEVSRGKPFPDVYLEAAKRLDVPIERCIVIDDAPGGVRAGRDAGAYTIAVPSKWTGHLDFSPAHAVCGSLTEVQHHISGFLGWL